MIAFSCSKCGKQLSVKPEFAGRSSACPTCKEPLIVPAAADSPAQATLVSGGPDAGATLMPVGCAPSVLGRAGVEAAITLGQPDEPLAVTRRTVPQVLAANVGSRERYVEEEVIGQGGMATVVRAVDCDIRREVAIKTMQNQTDARAKRRFVEEAQITGQLEHPNICPVHELGIDGRQRLFLSMKLVKGQSLAQVLQELRDHPRTAERRFTPSRLVSIFVAVCNAMAYAHSRGVIHRDLKPANIMIGDFGEVYVMDWGLARVLAGELQTMPPPLPGAGPEWDIVPRAPDQVVTDRDQNLELTRDGAVIGTPSYMSPEQAFADLQAIDRRSDVYSLGVILYELLTLEPPHDRAGGIGAVLARVREGKIVPPAERAPERARAGKVPAELSAIALKAMSRSPADRYRDAAALKQDVELFVDGRSVSAKEDSWRELFIKFVRRNRALSAAAVLVLATVLIGGGISYWRISASLDKERKAHAKYEEAQTERDERTRLAVPAMMVVARQCIEQREFDRALEQVNLALHYREGYPDALLLRAQLRIANREFKDAWGDLQSYQLHVSKSDPLVSELTRLCDPDIPPDATTYLQLARVLERQGSITLAEAMVRHIDPGAKNIAEARTVLLSLYRERVDNTWKGRGAGVTLAKDGSFALSLSGDDVIDLTPLKGLLLTALVLHECPNLCQLDSLKGLPITSLQIMNCAAVRDLNGLKGMQITRLALLNATGLASLSGVEDLPLVEFSLDRSPLSDLSPLRKLRLTSISLSACLGVEDLSVLTGMPLTTLLIHGCSGVLKLPSLRGAPCKTISLYHCQGLTDLSGLKGLPLTSLNLAGCAKLRDLSPLEGLPLAILDLSGCGSVHDLKPLNGMPLEKLVLRDFALLTDLSGLKGLSLVELDLSGCSRLTALSPLADMPLRQLSLDGCVLLEDLTALRKMPLTKLILTSQAKNLDLSPLGNCPLVEVRLYGCTGITDVNGLAGMKIGRLYLVDCPALMDLSGLKGMAIEELVIQGCSQLDDLSPLSATRCSRLSITSCDRLRSLSPLRTVMSLRSLTIVGCRGIDDLSALKGLQLSTVAFNGCTDVRDLSPLKGMPLVVVYLTGCRNVVDIRPLAGTKVTTLHLTDTGVKDLTPLRGISTLQLLHLNQCPDLHDLTPLDGLKLTTITVPPQPTKGMEVLRKMSTLTSIDGKAASQFWQEWDRKAAMP
jgi:serine/threonine protein kinase